MKITPFNYEKHAEEVGKWGETHKFPLPAKEFLPDTGLMVNDTAVGFLYLTNSKLGWIEWVFSNPAKTSEERKDAIDKLFSVLEATAITLGMKAIFSAAGSDAYKHILERNGFDRTDTNMTQYVKGIA